MSWRSHIVFVFAAAALIAGHALADRVPGSGSAAPVPRKFSHQAHISRGVPIAKHCQDCHHSGPRHQLVAVGQQAHQPCLASGCHVSDFLVAGRPEAARDDRYLRAVGFCLGCHPAGADGAPPRPHEKAQANHVFKGNARPDYHVEFNHYNHTEDRARCSHCHVVDEKTFALQLATPGHAECGECHGSSASPPMTACGNCHFTPGPTDYFVNKRPDTDVRSCDSPRHAELEKRLGRSVPCFKHEREQHRMRKGKPLECDACHFLIANKSSWTSKWRYETLLEVKSGPLLNNDRSEAHNRCGTSGCHQKDVHPSRGDCTLCHARQKPAGFK
jgi:hypothetical protein